jgi:hypothetical protein
MMLEAKTRDLIRRLQPSAPVNVTGIARFLGLNVWESTELPDTVAGKLLRDSKNGGVGGYSIVVRAQDPLVRKRFTVAHEVAHYLRHSHLISREIVDDALYRSALSSPMEAQANALAAEILMPHHLLTPIAQLVSLEDLAEKFQVSNQAMRIRLGQQVNA